MNGKKEMENISRRTSPSRNSVKLKGTQRGTSGRERKSLGGGGGNPAKPWGSEKERRLQTKKYLEAPRGFVRGDSKTFMNQGKNAQRDPNQRITKTPEGQKVPEKGRSKRESKAPTPGCSVEKKTRARPQVQGNLRESGDARPSHQNKKRKGSLKGEKKRGKVRREKKGSTRGRVRATETTEGNFMKPSGMWRAGLKIKIRGPHFGPHWGKVKPESEFLGPGGGEKSSKAVRPGKNKPSGDKGKGAGAKLKLLKGTEKQGGEKTRSIEAQIPI